MDNFCLIPFCSAFLISSESCSIEPIQISSLPSFVRQIGNGVLISSEDIPGWSVASAGGITVALDVTLTDDLKREGIARDFVNRIQNLRKDMGLEVLDKISIEVERNGDVMTSAISEFKQYISTETQAVSLEIKDNVANAAEVDMDESILKVLIRVIK